MTRFNLKIKNSYGSKLNQTLNIDVPDGSPPELGGLVTWQTKLHPDGYGLAVVEKIRDTNIVAKLLEPNTEQKLRTYINSQLPTEPTILT